MGLREKIEVAKEEKEGDIILKNVKIVNVFDNSIEESDIIIYENEIVGVGKYNKAREIYNLKGYYASPGLIDSHIHIESTSLTPGEFAKAVVPQGTLAVIADPHEIANVAGVRGIKYMLNASENLPMDIFFMLPSCVPSSPYENSGARLNIEHLYPFLSNERVLGLGEMMNYPGVLNYDTEVLKKLEYFKNKIIDGHAPFLLGNNLNAYITGGIKSDHECTNLPEAREKLKKGMYIMIREGSAARDLDALFPLIDSNTYPQILLCTDDRHPKDLINEGHINSILKKLVKKGLDPILSIRLATLNPARYFNLMKIGGIAPNYYANIVIFSDLINFEPILVFYKGNLVAKEGVSMFSYEKTKSEGGVKNTVNIKTLTYDKIKIKALKDYINVIGASSKSLITERYVLKAKIEDGYVVSDTKRDILKMVVVERHKATGNVGVGFVKGFKLKEGAIASSIAHDHHNIISIGTNDKDILLSISILESYGGGISITKNGKVLHILSLPYGGLMTDKSAKEVNEEYSKLLFIANKLGVELEDPFMTLSFMALPVIPHLKITDIGLVDTDNFKVISIFDVGG
ncbi:MAG: adenine deaminase [Caldisericia bacterium]